MIGPQSPLQVAQSERRPHSLIASRRFWQLLASSAGIEAWSYAYEGGHFFDTTPHDRFSDPAYAKCERAVARKEKSIRRKAFAFGILFVSLGHVIPSVKPASPVYVSLGQSQYQVPASVPTVVSVKLGVR